MWSTVLPRNNNHVYACVRQRQKKERGSLTAQDYSVEYLGPDSICQHTPTGSFLVSSVTILSVTDPCIDCQLYSLLYITKLFIIIWLLHIVMYSLCEMPISSPLLMS